MSYEELRQQVLHRDGWRCQSCGSMSNLEVYHRQFRSQSAADSDENLITLGSNRHLTLHAMHSRLTVCREQSGLAADHF